MVKKIKLSLPWWSNYRPNTQNSNWKKFCVSLTEEIVFLNPKVDEEKMSIYFIVDKCFKHLRKCIKSQISWQIHVASRANNSQNLMSCYRDTPENEKYVSFWQSICHNHDRLFTMIKSKWKWPFIAPVFHGQSKRKWLTVTLLQTANI